MKIHNNYVSIVVLGNFNPSILTPNFMINYCDFPKGIELKRGDTTVVVSSLDYGDIAFIAELERFQAIERNIEDTRNIRILKYLINYFEILKYTPINILGVNFNTTIEKVKQAVFNTLDKSDKIKDFFDIEELNYSKTINLGVASTTNLSWKLTYNTADGYKTRTVINLKNNNLIINKNFEIKVNRGENIRDIIILKEYSDFEKKYSSFLKFLTKGD